MSCLVELIDVRVVRDERAILDGVSLRVARGEAVAIIGRSGAGKTTAIKVVNGIVAPEAGTVRLDGQSLAASDLVALRRRIGYVVQGVGLFPHRTVAENVGMVPRLLGWPQARIASAVESILDSVGLEPAHYGGRYPHSLSGGEQQRVGIARALAPEPDVLLCDEPFGALDPIVRRDLQELFVRLRRERGTTMLFVTHDLAEALFVGDRVVLIDAGRVVADSDAREFTSLADPIVRRFVDASGLGGEQ
ncbi:MAG: ATP-binding cassette domain-containing protein [Acidobacteria bacterium]|nr:ATP-binding cassette domain-containing protein [Acidobacteriota bacterium]